MVLSKPIYRKLNLLVLIPFVWIALTACGSSGKNSDGHDYKPVAVTSVVYGPITSMVEYSGRVEARKETYVVSQLPGRVLETFYQVGDRVRKGDLLFKVDTAEMEDAILVLEEQLKVAEANVSLAQNSVSAAWGSQHESMRLQLESALSAAESAYLSAKGTFDDYARLYDMQKINRSQYMEIKGKYDQAVLGLDSARNQYDLYMHELSKENIDKADDLLAQAEASRDMIRVQIENARKKLEQAFVTAPVNGVVHMNNITTGGMVSAQMAACGIMDQNPLVVKINVTEQVINFLNKGDCVAVDIPSAGKVNCLGEITLISPSADPMSKAYHVGIELSNEDGTAKPGMTAKVRINTEKHDSVLKVPQGAVLSEEGESFVFIAESGKAIRKAVQTGISDGKSLEVTEGLKAGDLLIVKGQQYLKDQDAVKIVRKGE